MAWLSNRLGKEGADILVLPGAFDALSARIIARSGFEAIYCGGFAAAASQFAAKDIGLLDASELAAHFGRLKAANPITPLVVDGDTGHGNQDKVRRTIRQFASVHVDAVHIEDQVNPKQCGLQGAPTTVDRTVAVERIRTAVQTGVECGVSIIGRTDCASVMGLSEAISRCNAFLDEGADAVWINGISAQDCSLDVVGAINGPLIFNKGPDCIHADDQNQDLSNVGIAAVIAPAHALLCCAEAVRQSLIGTADRQASDQIAPISIENLHDLLEDDRQVQRSAEFSAN